MNTMIKKSQSKTHASPWLLLVRSAARSFIISILFVATFSGFLSHVPAFLNPQSNHSCLPVELSFLDFPACSQIPAVREIASPVPSLLSTKPNPPKTAKNHFLHLFWMRTREEAIMVPRPFPILIHQVFCILLVAMLLGPVRGEPPVSKTEKGEAQYVDSKAIRERFDQVTAVDMEMLRGKKILLVSRSFGLNLFKGLTALAREDKKYDLLSSYQRYDVFKAGGNVDIIPPDALQKTNFVHFMGTYWPHTKRLEDMNRLLQDPPQGDGFWAESDRYGPGLRIRL